MLIPPGTAAFARRPFHTPPPNSSISSRQRDPQRCFVAAGPLDVTAQAVELRPEAAGVAGIVGIGRHADRLEPVDAAVEDVRHAGDGLDVVDDRRLAEQRLRRPGNGGLIRGQARLPSRLSISPVSSPQM